MEEHAKKMKEIQDFLQKIRFKDVSVAPCNFSALRQDWLSAIIATVYTDKEFRFVGIRECLRRTFRRYGLIDVYRFKDEIFRIQFKSAKIAKYILDNGPWNFERDLILMRACNPKLSPAAYTFDDYSIWTQVHGLASGLLSEEIMVPAIEEQLGEVSPMFEGQVKQWLSFARVRVAGKASDMIRDILNIDAPWKEVVTGNLSFERLARHCSFCRVIGHDIASCTFIRTTRAMLKVAISPSAKAKLNKELNDLLPASISVKGLFPTFKYRHYETTCSGGDQNIDDFNLGDYLDNSDEITSALPLNMKFQGNSTSACPRELPNAPFAGAQESSRAETSRGKGPLIIPAAAQYRVEEQLFANNVVPLCSVNYQAGETNTCYAATSRDLMSKKQQTIYNSDDRLTNTRHAVNNNHMLTDEGEASNLRRNTKRLAQGKQAMVVSSNHTVYIYSSMQKDSVDIGFKSAYGDSSDFNQDFQEAIDGLFNAAPVEVQHKVKRLQTAVHAFTNEPVPEMVQKYGTEIQINDNSLTRDLLMKPHLPPFNTKIYGTEVQISDKNLTRDVPMKPHLPPFNTNGCRTISQTCKPPINNTTEYPTAASQPVDLSTSSMLMINQSHTFQIPAKRHDSLLSMGGATRFKGLLSTPDVNLATPLQADTQPGTLPGPRSMDGAAALTRRGGGRGRMRGRGRGRTRFDCMDM